MYQKHTDCYLPNFHPNETGSKHCQVRSCYGFGGWGICILFSNNYFESAVCLSIRALCCMMEMKLAVEYFPCFLYGEIIQDWGNHWQTPDGISKLFLKIPTVRVRLPMPGGWRRLRTTSISYHFNIVPFLETLYHTYTI